MSKSAWIIGSPVMLYGAERMNAPASFNPVAAVPSFGIVIVIVSLVPLVKVKVIANPDKPLPSP